MSEISVQCTHCGVKLKLKDSSKVGKTVPCPKCKRPFVVQPAAEDEFDFSFEETDAVAETAPVVAPRRSGRPAGTSAKSKKRTSSSGGSKSGLLIGLGVLTLLVFVGVGLWAAGVFSRDEPAPVAQQAAPAPDSVPTAAHAGAPSTSPQAHAAVPTGAPPSATTTAATAASSGAAAATNPPARPALTPIDFSWLPEDAELIVNFRFADLRAAPLLQGLLSDPPPQQRMGGLVEQIGIGMDEIESITAGIQVPDTPGVVNAKDLRGVGTVRLNKPADPVRFAGLGEAVTHGTHTYYRVQAPEQADQTGAVAVMAPTLLLIGDESSLQQALDRGAGSATNPRFSFTDGSQHVLLAASLHRFPERWQQLESAGNVPDSFLRWKGLFDKGARGVGLGLKLTNGLELALAVSATDAASAQQIQSDLGQFVAEQQGKLAEGLATMPPFVASFVKPLADNLNAIQDGSIARLTTSVDQAALTEFGKSILPLLAMSAMPGGAQPGFSLPGATPAFTPSDLTFSPGSFSVGGTNADEIIKTGQPASSAEGLPPGFELRAAAAWSEVMSFGQTVAPPAPLTVRVVAFRENGESIVGYGRLNVRAQSADGTPLKRRGNDFSGDGWDFVRVSRSGFGEHPQNGVTVPIAFHHPTSDLPAIAALEGSVTLQTAGESKAVAVPSLTAVLNKEPADADLKAAGVRVVKHAQEGFGETLIITCGVGSAVLGGVEAIDKAGGAHPEASVGTQTMNGRQQFTIGTGNQGKLPADLRLRFTIHKDVEEHPVTFRFDGLPVPSGKPLTDEQRTLVTWRASTAPAQLPDGTRVEARARWSKFPTFDQQTNKQTHPLEVAVDVVGGPAQNAVAIGFLKVDQAVIGGTPLEPKKDPFSFRDVSQEYVSIDRGFSLDEAPPDGVQAKFQFDPPPPPAQPPTVVQTFSGSLKLQTVDEQKVVYVKNAAAAAGKPINDPALREAGLTLRVERSGNGLAVRLVKGDANLIQSVTAVDGGGSPLPDVTVGTMTFNNQIAYALTSQSDLPRDTGLRITLNVGLKEVSVPFKFEDLPVPAAPKQ